MARHSGMKVPLAEAVGQIVSDLLMVTKGQPDVRLWFLVDVADLLKAHAQDKFLYARKVQDLQAKR